MFSFTAKEQPPVASGLEELRTRARSWTRHHGGIMARECHTDLGSLEDFTENRRHTLDAAVLDKLARYVSGDVMRYDVECDALVRVTPLTIIPSNYRARSQADVDAWLASLPPLPISRVNYRPNLTARRTYPV